MEIHGARVPKGRRQSDAQMEQDRDRTLPSSTAVSISEIIEERRVARQSEIVLPKSACIGIEPKMRSWSSYYETSGVGGRRTGLPHRLPTYKERLQIS